MLFNGQRTFPGARDSRVLLGPPGVGMPRQGSSPPAAPSFNPNAGKASMPRPSFAPANQMDPRVRGGFDPYAPSDGPGYGPRTQDEPRGPSENPFTNQGPRARNPWADMDMTPVIKGPPGNRSVRVGDMMISERSSPGLFAQYTKGQQAPPQPEFFPEVVLPPGRAQPIPPPPQGTPYDYSGSAYAPPRPRRQPMDEENDRLLQAMRDRGEAVAADSTLDGPITDADEKATVGTGRNRQTVADLKRQRQRAAQKLQDQERSRLQLQSDYEKIRREYPGVSDDIAYQIIEKRKREQEAAGRAAAEAELGVGPAPPPRPIAGGASLTPNGLPSWGGGSSQQFRYF